MKLSIVLALACTFACSVPSLSYGAQTFTVIAEKADCREAPVSVTVPDLVKGKEALVLKTDQGRFVPCQLETTPDGPRLTWIVRGLMKGERRKYTVAYSNEAQMMLSVVPVKLKESEGAVAVIIGGSLFTTYIYSGALKPYCYPIVGPGGRRVTRNYPMQAVPGEDSDHPHHRALWFTHGDVNGTDFWTEGAKAGKTVHRSFEALEGGLVFGRICSINDWIAPDGKRVCEDRREIKVYNTSNGKTMDFEITIRATEGPVKFGDTKEGMFGIRVASSMDADKGGHIVNSRGDKDGDAWGKQAEWCDYSGPVDGKVMGIAVLDSPTSFRYPTYWHVRTYGLFAANPFGLHDYRKDDKLDGSYTIPAGGEMTFRYRIFIHKGDAESAGVRDIYQAYTDPPRVVLAQ